MWKWNISVYSTSICSMDAIIYEKNPEYLIQVVIGNRHAHKHPRSPGLPLELRQLSRDPSLSPCRHTRNNSRNNSRNNFTALPHFLLTNACSILNKFHEMECRFTRECADAAVITESWITPNTSPDTYSVDGYNIFNKCRTNRSGGGVLLYVKDHIRATVFEDIAVPPKIKGEWIMLNQPKFRDVYHPLQFLWFTALLTRLMTIFYVITSLMPQTFFGHVSQALAWSY